MQNLTNQNIEKTQNSQIIQINNLSSFQASPSLSIIPSPVIQTENDNNINNDSDLLSILKEIPLHNLNDYYNIETNIFKKRIEKLNLQFFWTYESILEGQNTNNNNTDNSNINNDSKQNLIFPYNKLFLILFKEISLYIEEIMRLNKQLDAKNKNEKLYLKKLNDYKIKEKEYLTNKQIIKNLQRNIRNLEKNNEKIKNENEKLSKKLFSEKYSHIKGFGGNNNNSNNNKYEFSINNNINNYKYQNYQKAHTIYNEYYGFNNLTEQGNLTSSNVSKFSFRTFLNKSKDKNIHFNKSPSKDFLNIINKDMNKLINSCDRLYEKDDDKYFDNNEIDNDNKNIIALSITQCQDEINNLNKIENLLMNYIQNEDKTLTKEKNKSFKKVMNTPINNIKYKINSKQNDNSMNKKFLFSDKKYKKIKSLDFRTNIIVNRNKN